MQGFGPVTAEIHYRLPDYQDLLQLLIWQEYDITPDFPTLKHFLDYWEREIEGPLHSVRVAHPDPALRVASGGRRHHPAMTQQEAAPS